MHGALIANMFHVDPITLTVDQFFGYVAQIKTVREYRERGVLPKAQISKSDLSQMTPEEWVEAQASGAKPEEPKAVDPKEVEKRKAAQLEFMRKMGINIPPPPQRAK